MIFYFLLVWVSVILLFCLYVVVLWGLIYIPHYFLKYIVEKDGRSRFRMVQYILEREVKCGRCGGVLEFRVCGHGHSFVYCPHCRGKK